MKKNKKKTPSKFNIYTMMNKHRKKVVGSIATVIIVALILGLFSQFAYM